MAPKTRRKRRSPAEARRLLIEAARDALVQGGGDFEMMEVASRAGVSEGLAYYHFGNKPSLLDAVVRDFYEQLDESVMAVPFPGDTWVERERARIAEFVRLMYEDPIAPLVLNVLRVNPALHAEEQDRRRRLNALGARNIAEAQRDGEISPEHDPQMLVAMILGGVMAGVTEALTDSRRRPLKEVQATTFAFVLRAAGIRQEAAAEHQTTEKETDGILPN
ncbi:MAG: TetR/AcrR family transcriptional regulator [Myxococcota bacterium]